MYYHLIIFDILELPRSSPKKRILNLNNIYSPCVIKQEFYGYLNSNKLYKFFIIGFNKYCINDITIQKNYENEEYIYGYKKIDEYNAISTHSSFRGIDNYKRSNDMATNFIYFLKCNISDPLFKIDEKMINSIIEKYDYKSKVYPKVFNGKTKYITMSTDIFEPKEKWEGKIISTIVSKTDYTLTGWFIVPSPKVLEIVRYLNIHFPNDYIFIKDPKSYEDVASILRTKYSKKDESHGIIFLLTKDFPDIQSIIQELNEGIIFYNHEPIFLSNPHIIVFSNFVPIIYSKDILDYYTDIEILNEGSDTLEKTSFKLEENLLS